MRKTLTYSTFVAASFLVIAAFVTAKTYVQLGIAVALYPLLVFFALKIFPRKSYRALEFTMKMPRSSTEKIEEGEIDKKRVEVVDIDKRTFLKLIGTAGLTFFLFSFLGRKAETFLSGRGFGTPASSSDEGGASGALANGGYKISEVDEGNTTYYGFINKDGGWLIMRVDTETNTFRYAKGDFEFPKNWEDRGNLKYDYFSNLF